MGKALKTAQREAEAAFGVGDVYLEKYVENPRHIEVQVLGDHHGAVVHLGERECSIQRRHQKLLEEAPSVALTEKMRRKLGSTVVDAARAVQYTNAGTFEFLLDDKGSFYFLEVNTRLQVEHPVTEFLTGVDIVKEQIRIAAGERLSFKQGDVTFTGHAIECRDQRRGSGDLRALARRDPRVQRAGRPRRPRRHFAHSECTIPPYYDSMIAKIIVHGRDRQEAIARMRRTLEMTVIEGIKTTIPLHLRILDDPDFVAGRLSTALHGALPRREKKPAGPASRKPVLTSLAARVTGAILYPIIDTDVCAARGFEPPRSPAPACDGGARLLQVRDKSRRRAPLPRSCRRSRARGAPPAARVSSSTTAPTSRRSPGPTACTSGRTISASPTCARIVGPRRWSASRPTRRTQIDRALDSDASYVAVGPVFGTATKRHGLRARADSSLVRLCRRPRQADRGDRRHHPGARAGGRGCRRVGGGGDQRSARRTTTSRRACAPSSRALPADPRKV